MVVGLGVKHCKALEHGAKLDIVGTMKVTAAELAANTQSILDRVIESGEIAEIQRQGKTVAEIRRKFGTDRKKMVELLKGINFSRAETRELKQAMEAAAEVLGYAGRD